MWFNTMFNEQSGQKSALQKPQKTVEKGV